MSQQHRSVENLSAAEIARLLAEMEQLDDEQAEEVTSFVSRIGGIENALHAVEMLRQLEDAA